ncbi:MAG: hypothetical protein J7M19_09790 [Planctomycetes bacterium]|nr:hypothetical protein [Planctomycetota bacterium]
MPVPLSDLEKRVITAVRGGLDPARCPFRSAAGKAGCSEAQIVRTLRSLAERGLVKRVSAILNPAALGLASAALVAWRVPEGDLEAVGGALAEKPFITHCIARKTRDDWPYNLYTMMHGEDEASIRAEAGAISARFHIEDFVILETCEELKKEPAGYRFEEQERDLQ